MTFLNPSALFALIAAGIPVLLHFLNLRKLKKVEISSLAFLKELQKNKIKRIKLRQWLLLAIRVLLIACLVLAFSKPALRPSGLFSSGARTSAVIIIDNSFSMSPVDDGGSLFNKAKQAALNLLDSFNPGDEIRIILTCGPESETGTASSDFMKVKKTIEDSKISTISTPLMKSVIEGGRFLSESSNVNRELFIISDFQKSALTSESLNNLLNEKTFNKFTRIYLLEPEGKQSANLSVTGLSADNVIFEPGKNVSFKGTVSNFSPTSVENSTASLFINGKRCAQQGITLKSGETKEIRFETELKDSGLLNISVELEEDAVEYDNIRYLSLFVPGRINICILSDVPEDMFYVKTVLETAGENLISLTEKKTGQINGTDLSKYNLLIICGCEGMQDFTPINNYLSDGGNIILFPEKKTTAVGYNRLCNALGLPGAESLVASLPRESAQVFGKIDFSHPLTSGIFEKGADLRPSSPLVYTYLKLKPGTGSQIISLAGGIPFLTENRSGKGKVLQFAALPVPEFTDFPAKAFFAPLIQRCAGYLSVRFTDEIAHICGEPIQINSASGEGIKAELPDGSSVILNKPVSGALLLNKTAMPGLYKFYEGGKLIDFSSLNFDAKEAAFESIHAEGFKDLLKDKKIESPAAQLNMKNNIKQELEAARFGTELWKHFLILALLFASAEMILSRASRKDLE